MGEKHGLARTRHSQSFPESRGGGGGLWVSSPMGGKKYIHVYTYVRRYICDAECLFCLYRIWVGGDATEGGVGLVGPSNDGQGGSGRGRPERAHVGDHDECWSINGTDAGSRQSSDQEEKELREEGDEDKTVPFLLGERIPPVPAHLVARIWKGEFLDMADLLRDNPEVERRRIGVQGASPHQGQAKALRQEVPDVLLWAQCFGVYTGMIAEKHPCRIKQLLAYQVTILREARRCGGRGWRSYDSMFGHLAAADNSMDWSRLNPSLYATIFLA